MHDASSVRTSDHDRRSLQAIGAAQPSTATLDAAPRSELASDSDLSKANKGFSSGPSLVFSCCGGVRALGSELPAPGCRRCQSLQAFDSTAGQSGRTIAETALAHAAAEVVVSVITDQRAELIQYFGRIADSSRIRICEDLDGLPAVQDSLRERCLLALNSNDSASAGAVVQSGLSLPAGQPPERAPRTFAARGPRVARAIEQFRCRPSPDGLIARFRDLVARIRTVQVPLSQLKRVVDWGSTGQLQLVPHENESFATVVRLSPRGLLEAVWPWTFGVPYDALDVANPYWAKRAIVSKTRLDDMNRRRILRERLCGFSPGQIAGRLGLRGECVAAVLHRPDPQAPDPAPQTDRQKKTKDKEEQAQLKKLQRAAAKPPRLDPLDAQRLAECQRMLKRYRADSSVTLADARESLLGPEPSLPFAAGIPGGPPPDRDSLLPPVATLRPGLNLQRSPDGRWQQALNEVYQQSPRAELTAVDRAVVRRAKRLMFMIDQGTVIPASPECRAYQLWCQPPARQVVESLLLAGMPAAQIDGVVDVPAGTCQQFEDFFAARVVSPGPLASGHHGPGGGDSPRVRCAGHLLNKLARQGTGAGPVLKALSYLSQAAPDSVPPGLTVNSLSDADYLECHFHWTATQVQPLALAPLLEIFESFRTLRIRKETPPPAKIDRRSSRGRVRDDRARLEDPQRQPTVTETQTLLLLLERT